MAATQPSEAIIIAARRQATDAGVLIAFADSGYLDVLMNWLVALAAIGVREYLVVALDAPLFGFLRDRGIPVVLSEVCGDLSALWIRRIQVFATLCRAGIDFIHSDVDAVWLSDPRREFFAGDSADLVISQGTVWPPDVHAAFGFVLCCGLFQLRAKAGTQALLDELEPHVLTTRDDQVSLNRLIAARAPVWELRPEDSYAVEGAGTRFLASRRAFRGRCRDGLTVSVLPHHLFRRVPASGRDSGFGATPQVLHLLTRKDPRLKLQEFARAGCLLLRSDWRTQEFAADSLLCLRRDA